MLEEIEKQFPSRNKVSLALDELTSTDKLAITLVIGYNMHPNWALGEVQQAFDEVDHQILSAFESLLRMRSQRPTHWSKGSCTFAECPGPF